MIDLELLKKRGVSVEAWRTVFTADDNRQPTYTAPRTEYTGYGSGGVNVEVGDKGADKKSFTGPNALRNRIRTRIQNGRDSNINNFKIFHALDLAWDVPLKKSITPSLIHGLMDKTVGSAEKVKQTLSAWGMDLDDVVTEVMDGKVDGKAVYKVNAPSFFQIFVPLVKAYATIRQAKIMNDMLVTPFFEYTPAFENARSRLQCDVITSRVEVMSEQFGYYDVIKQCVFQMLHYGRCLQFPIEEWYSEIQEVDEPDLADQQNGAPVKDKNERYTRVVKEGLRYHMPHPTRCFFDQAHAACTFNTDTGCEFAGYWRVFRYRDVLNMAGFYNRDRITIGNYQWINSWSTFFQTVYPCTLSFPTLNSQPTNDRETKLIDQVYSEEMGDKAIVLTEYFEKLIPADYDLGDYHYPIWCRFVVAGDDTIIYAAPLPYPPVIYYAYDDDQARSMNASLSLEVLPWQDHFSNLLTQYLLTIKQNLANVTFVDENIVDRSYIDALKGFAEQIFRKRNFIPFKGPKFRAEHKTPEQAFWSATFPQMDTNSLVQAMKLMLDILERVLQMSAQELGAAASHEQSAKEMGIISQHTSTRLTYTATPVHQGRNAMKAQLYKGLMAYGEDEFWAEVPFDRQIDEKMLEDLGFTYAPDKPVHPHSRKMTVRASKSALLLERFSSKREGEQREENPEMARALVGMIETLLKGPIGPAIGTSQAIELLNLSTRLAGIPRDFKLKDMSPKLTPDQEAEQVKQQLSGFIDEIKSSILGEVKQGLMPILERQKQDEAAIAHITQIIEVAEAHRPPTGPPGMQPVPVPNGVPNGASNGLPASPFRY